MYVSVISGCNLKTMAAAIEPDCRNTQAESESQLVVYCSLFPNHVRTVKPTATYKKTYRNKLPSTSQPILHKLGQLLVGQELIEECLDTQQFSDDTGVFPWHTHQVGHRHEQVGTQQLKYAIRSEFMCVIC